MDQYIHKKSGIVATYCSEGYTYNHPSDNMPVWLPKMLICTSLHWEKVEEPKPKDWEILSFFLPGTKDRYYQKDARLNDSYLINPVGNTDDMLRSHVSGDDLLNKYKYVVRSVKRLSDGEVFTVGDKSQYGTIISFWTINGTMKVKAAQYDMDLSIITIAKPILQLPDENGKMIDMYEGSNFFYVANSNIFPSPVTRFTKVTVIPKFATREAAEKSIFENRKEFSKTDLLSIINQCMTSNGKIDVTRLKCTLNLPRNP